MVHENNLILLTNGNYVNINNNLLKLSLCLVIIMGNTCMQNCISMEVKKPSSSLLTNGNEDKPNLK